MRSRAIAPSGAAMAPRGAACASSSLETLTSSSPLKYASTRASHAAWRGESGSAEADATRGGEAEQGSCCTSRWCGADVERRLPCVQPQQGRGGGAAGARVWAQRRGGAGVQVRRVPESLGVEARRSRCVCAAAAGATRRDPRALHRPRRLAGVPMPRGGLYFSG
jgi:hypothetical protein